MWNDSTGISGMLMDDGGQTDDGWGCSGGW